MRCQARYRQPFALLLLGLVMLALLCSARHLPRFNSLQNDSLLFLVLHCQAMEKKGQGGRLAQPLFSRQPFRARQTLRQPGCRLFALSSKSATPGRNMIPILSPPAMATRIRDMVSSMQQSSFPRQALNGHRHPVSCRVVSCRLVPACQQRHLTTWSLSELTRPWQMSRLQAASLALMGGTVRRCHLTGQKCACISRLDRVPLSWLPLGG
ncbi:hypothetical protein IWX90DRAFT_275676 [Phyllosticta citrichinensis]|uniref:Secreted protein n=1 Tax=Phyllosticta citrichinensis TaxID=1130410 RepID=A0ABR1XNA1_9PEZI